MPKELEEIFQNAKDAKHEASVREYDLAMSIPSIGQDIPDEARFVEMIEERTSTYYNTFEIARYFSKPKLTAAQSLYLEGTLKSFIAVLRLGKSEEGEERKITVGEIRRMDRDILDGTGLTYPQQILIFKLFRKFAPAPEGELELDVL